MDTVLGVEPNVPINVEENVEETAVEETALMEVDVQEILLLFTLSRCRCLTSI